MMKKFLGLVFLATIAAGMPVTVAPPRRLNFTDSGNGLDLSYFQGDVSQDSFNCLHQNGLDFAIFQAQTQDGSFNDYCINDYLRAKAAGFAGVDFYVYPNRNGDPVAQINNVISRLRGAGVLQDNMIWLDIEGADDWPGDQGSNVNFISAMVNAVTSQYSGCGGRPCVGIYSNANSWNPITGGSTAFSNLGLWWPYYDGEPHVQYNWSPFGGWSAPDMKQWQGTTGICGTSIDSNTWNS